MPLLDVYLVYLQPHPPPWFGIYPNSGAEKVNRCCWRCRRYTEVEINILAVKFAIFTIGWKIIAVRTVLEANRFHHWMQNYSRETMDSHTLSYTFLIFSAVCEYFSMRFSPLDAQWNSADTCEKPISKIWTKVWQKYKYVRKKWSNFRNFDFVAKLHIDVAIFCDDKILIIFR